MATIHLERSFGGNFLPITRRGNFYKDAFFSDFQKDFSSAVQDVMDKWGTRSRLADHLTSYRNLKSDKPVEDTITASISETGDNYVIILDMSDFVSGEISVRTKSRYAVVEAKAGKFSFSKRFALPPNTNYNAVVAAMSDDGILTITAPKNRRKQSQSQPAGTPTFRTDAGETQQQSQPIGTVTKVSSEATESFSGASKGERVIPLVVEGEEESMDSSAASVTASETSKTEGDTSAANGSSTMEVTLEERVLPISKRGRFFQDGFFEKVWKDFESALEEADQKEARHGGVENTSQQQGTQEQEMQQQQKEIRQETSTSQSAQEELLQPHPRKFERLHSYQNIRDWALQDDTQAATVSEDDKNYKVVLDVRNFMNDKLAVKALERGVEVTGCQGELSFRKKFTLPSFNRPSDVTASLSEDGVLTITAPK